MPGPDVIGPLGGKTITFLESSAGGRSDQTTVDIEATPFRGEDHIHPKAEEHIEVLDGVVTVRVGDVRRELTTGQHVAVSPGVIHGWSNLSDRSVRIRIRFRPGLGIENYLRTTYGLHSDGRVGSAGRLHLLQTAVLSADYREMVVFELVAWRRTAYRALAPIGRLAGYRPTYPEYQRPVVVPDSVASARPGEG